MSKLLSLLKEQANKTLHNPRRIFSLVRPGAWAGLYLTATGKNNEWHASESGLRNRGYQAYQDYLQHQASKLKKISLDEYDQRYAQLLFTRLQQDDLSLHGKNALCLAARIGTEVKAFKRHGCFAVGIDLNPGKDNQHVHYGDFHALQFPDGCVDAVFTNSLDHVLHLDKIMSEVRRVLKNGGHFIVEMVNGTEQGVQPGFYESLSWENTEQLIVSICIFGFEVVKRQKMTDPWEGEHVCFRKI